MGIEAAQGIASFVSGFGQRYGEIEDRRMRQEQIDMQRQGIELQRQNAADDRAFRQRQYEDLKAARDRDYSRQQAMDARTDEQYQSKLITANLVRELYEKPGEADKIGPTLAFHATRAGMSVGDVNNWMKEVKSVRDTGLGDAFKDAYTMNFGEAITKQNKVASKFGAPQWTDVSGNPREGFVFTYNDGRKEEVKPFDAAIRMTSYGYNPQKLIEQAQSATSTAKPKGQAVDLGDRVEFRDSETGSLIGEPMQKGIPPGRVGGGASSGATVGSDGAVAPSATLRESAKDKESARLTGELAVIDRKELAQVNANVRAASSALASAMGGKKPDSEAIAVATNDLKQAIAERDRIMGRINEARQSLGGQQQDAGSGAPAGIPVPPAAGGGASPTPITNATTNAPVADPAGQKLGQIAMGAKKLQTLVEMDSKSSIQGVKQPPSVNAPAMPGRQPTMSDTQLRSYLDRLESFKNNAPVVSGSVGTTDWLGQSAQQGIENAVPERGGVIAQGMTANKIRELRNDPQFVAWLRAKTARGERLPVNPQDLYEEYGTWLEANTRNSSRVGI